MTKQLEKQRKFNCAAMAYLKVWSETDHKALENVTRYTDQAKMGEVLYQLAIAYRVVRGISAKDADGNSLTEEGKTQRWCKIADTVQEIAKNDEPGHVLVSQLNSELKIFSAQKNKKTQEPYSLISASSKLLWFFPKTKVKIYDSQAVKALRNEKVGLSFKVGEYEDYVKCWERCISKYEQELNSAIAELPNLLPWTAVPYELHAAARQIISQPWFRERVFDQYLWAEGG